MKFSSEFVFSVFSVSYRAKLVAHLCHEHTHVNIYVWYI